MSYYRMETLDWTVPATTDECNNLSCRHIHVHYTSLLKQWCNLAVNVSFTQYFRSCLGFVSPRLQFCKTSKNFQILIEYCRFPLHQNTDSRCWMVCCVDQYKESPHLQDSRSLPVRTVYEWKIWPAWTFASIWEPYLNVLATNLWKVRDFLFW